VVRRSGQFSEARLSNKRIIEKQQNDCIKVSLILMPRIASTWNAAEPGIFLKELQS